MSNEKEIYKNQGWLPYQEYKNSDIEWIGQIPVRWNVKKVKYLSRFKYGDSLTEEARAEGNVPVYGSNGQVGTHSLTNTLAPCIIIGRKGSSGKLNYTDHACFAIDTTYFIDPSCTHVNIKWLYYALSCLNLDEVSRDSAVPGLNRDYAYNRFLPECSLHEQRSIVAFLDREAAKIDELIFKNQHLIELLEERRTALISLAVTKGLNLNAPMKDSGVEWLGKIPEHWEFRRNGYIFRERDERGFPDLPLLNVSIHTGVTLREFSNEHIEQMASDWNIYKRAKKGDLAFNKMRMWQGAVGVAPEDGLVSPDYIVAEPLPNVDARYYEYLFRLDGYKIEINRFSHGIVPDRNRLYWDQFKQIYSLYPPYNEQVEILKYINNVTRKIDTLIEAINKAVSNLTEYRTALISAAVTGKIDLRHFHQ